MQPNLHIPIHLSNHPHDVVNAVRPNLLQIPIPEPRLEQLIPLPVRGIGREIDLDRQLIMRDRILDPSDGTKECFFVDRLDLGLESRLHEGSQHGSHGRDTGLELCRWMQNPLGFHLLEYRVALDRRSVVSGLHGPGCLQLLDPLVHFGGGVVARGDLAVHLEERAHFGDWGEDGSLEHGEHVTCAGLAIRDAFESVRHPGGALAEDVFGAGEGDAAD